MLRTRRTFVGVRRCQPGQFEHERGRMDRVISFAAFWRWVCLAVHCVAYLVGLGRNYE